ncbi:MAG: SET domain-containing protein [Cyanobacteria bacterium]|nr:SET domain-containing protein [Cyanobacteriota bacterium]
MFSFSKIPAMCLALGQRAVRSESIARIFPLVVPRSAKYEEHQAELSPIVVPEGLRIGTETEKGGALYTTRRRREGEIVFQFQGYTRHIKNATPLGLQVEENLFLESDRDDPNRFDEFTNHSCDPNGYAYFNAGKTFFVATRDIEPGEELTFNYNTTEWDMFEQEEVMKERCVFQCFCGAKLCAGMIMGYKYLSLEQRLKWQPYLSPYLARKLRCELETLNVLLFSSENQIVS